MINISDIVDSGLKIIDKVIPDADAKQKAQQVFELELLKTLQTNDLGQVEVNKAEAQHSSIFVSGWRPFIGWVCGFAFAWQFVAFPLFSWLLQVYHPTIILPKIAAENLMELTFAMLGLGGLRSFEKFKKVARS